MNNYYKNSYCLKMRKNQKRLMSLKFREIYGWTYMLLKKKNKKQAKVTAQSVLRMWRYFGSGAKTKKI